VKSAYRERQQIVVTDLDHMLDHEISMLTTVIIGNSTTFVHDGLMITPRGYQRKYRLTASVQPLKPHERLRKEAEPWALEQMEPQATGDDEVKRTAVRNNPTVQVSADAHPRPDETRQTAGQRDMAGPDAVTGQAVDKHSRQVVYTARQRAKEVAEDALAALERRKGRKTGTVLFEAAVSPGVANKRFTAEQLLVLAEALGSDGKMTYTPDHYIKIERMTDDPDGLVAKLTAAGLTVAPVGNVLTVKACDFCDGEKRDAIPYAEELERRLGGMALPKELKLGINGCGMACYGAVREDIGIVYRKGKFDLFLGGKTIGRNAHPGRLVAEGLPPEEIVPVVTEVIEQYKEHAYPNERFYKFFERVKQVGRFSLQEAKPAETAEVPVCGD
ncbi:MAG: precorrin-3B C(17)-methyltransferase, partial [Bacillales bacterium]